MSFLPILYIEDEDDGEHSWLVIQGAYSVLQVKSKNAWDPSR